MIYIYLFFLYNFILVALQFFYLRISSSNQFSDHQLYLFYTYMFIDSLATYRQILVTRPFPLPLSPPFPIMPAL